MDEMPGLAATFNIVCVFVLMGYRLAGSADVRE